MSDNEEKRKRGHGPVYVEGGSAGRDEEGWGGEGACDRGSVMSFEMLNWLLFNGPTTYIHSRGQTCMHTRISPYSPFIPRAILSAHFPTLPIVDNLLHVQRM